MGVLKEILVVNVAVVLLMVFLLRYRRKKGKNIHRDDMIYNLMAVITLLGAVAETAAFLVDGKNIAGGYIVNYAANSLSFLGTVSIGFLWCVYVDLYVCKSYNKTLRRIKIIMIPWLIEIIAVIYNLFGTDFLFGVSGENLYYRGPYVVLGYVTLLIYFAYSIVIVAMSRGQALHLSFFPVYYFVAPCLAGVIAQFIWYGITTSWISVAIAMIFVQMQADTENMMTDTLSGIYNRKFLNRILTDRKIMRTDSLYGIMIDINDLKTINDKFGHSMGDKAISTVGDIIFNSVPDGGMPIRYAGDEFVVLLPGVS
jgi:predicted signal transduction protein with EAL and GGDEF domain